MEEIFWSCVKASTRDTQEVMHLGEEEIFTAAEVQWQLKG